MGKDAAERLILRSLCLCMRASVLLMAATDATLFSEIMPLTGLFSFESTKLGFLSGLRVLPYMMSKKLSDFFYPLPLVTVANQLILFLLSAFWGPPPPTHCRRHIWKPPEENNLNRSGLSFRDQVGTLSLLLFPFSELKWRLGRQELEQLSLSSSKSPRQSLP